MICKGLKRVFELPIIRAPRRNAKVYIEMWTNPCFAEGLLGAMCECAALHKSLTALTHCLRYRIQADASIGMLPKMAFERVCAAGHGVAGGSLAVAPTDRWAVALGQQATESPVRPMARSLVTFLSESTRQGILVVANQNAVPDALRRLPIRTALSSWTARLRYLRLRVVTARRRGVPARRELPRRTVGTRARADSINRRD